MLAATALAVPTAAHAGTIYPPSDACTTSSPTVAPGGSFTVECAAGTFSADDRVTLTVTGENGSAAAIGMVRFAISTASGFAAAAPDGSLSAVPVSVPDGATGSYNIAVVSPNSVGGTATVTITADGALAGTGVPSGSMLGLWVGGGALVAAGAAIAVAAVARRRQHAD